MQLFENISMAFASVRSNKMRSLLTMLGIIIGIAAVIAIVTVGNSMTGSVTDSMSGMGVSNITVTVKQKTSGDTQGTAQGVTLRRFMDETPGESDRITDAMIRDFYAAFPDKVDHFEYTVDVGQETISKYGDPTTTIKASVSGVNHDTLANKDDDSQILYGWTMPKTRAVCWPVSRRSSSPRPSAAARRMPSASPSRCRAATAICTPISS